MKQPEQDSPFLLIVDDDPSARVTLSILLNRAGYRVDEAADTQEARRKLEQRTYNVVVTDLRMGKEGGIEVLKAAKTLHPNSKIILLTAYGSIDSAVEAVKLGAFDYVTKPFKREEILQKIQEALAQKNIEYEAPSRKEPQQKRYSIEGIIAKSPQMHSVLDMASQVAKTDAVVLIQGESGTGKELMARAIHAWSHRAKKPFVTIDCGTLPENLLESELFGHMKGAFTGAIASKKGLFEEGNGGTVFLDEVEAMPPSIQMKFLRVLQEREIRRVGSTSPIQIDARILAATNQELKMLVEQGNFREDLYYRLHGVVLEIPPLRERREDIMALAEHFLQHFAQQMGRNIQSIAPEAMEILLQYPWPGNVRELEKAIERAIIFSRSACIRCEDFSPHLLNQSHRSSSPAQAEMDLDSLEKTHILTALYKHNWNRKKAAEELGINRTTLWRKMKEHQITPSS